MYCVRCGRLAREGERRCLECGMRLVSPAKLNRLLDEDRDRRNGLNTPRPHSKQNLKSANTAVKQFAGAAVERSTALLSGAAKWISEAVAAIRSYIEEKTPIIKKEFSFRFRKVKRYFRKKFRRFGKYLKLSKLHLPDFQHSRQPVNPKNTIKRKKKRRQSFTERNLRTIVAMSLIGLSFLVFIMWGTLSAPGMRTFASMGMGSSRGYILLGDKYMSGANYERAVESYYTALNKSGSYDAAFRLGRAYSYTGDMEKCVSALLYCTDNYPSRREPYVQLIMIYPNPGTRPDKVKEAIARGNATFNLE